MDRILHVFFPLRSVISRHDDIDTHGQSDKDIDHQVDQRRCGTHRRQRLAARETSHNDHIRSVEQKLQDSGKDQRNRKGEQFSEDRAVAHVHLVISLHNTPFPVSVFSFRQHPERKADWHFPSLSVCSFYPRLLPVPECVRHIPFIYYANYRRFLQIMQSCRNTLQSSRTYTRKRPDHGFPII